MFARRAVKGIFFNQINKMASKIRVSSLFFALLTITYGGPLPAADATTKFPSLVSQVVAGLGADATNGAAVASALLDDLESLPKSSRAPSTPAKATSALSSILSQTSNIFDAAAGLVANGFDPRNLANVVAGFSPEENSVTNENSRDPASPVYPRKSRKDAPYSLSESTLRGGIYFPSTFTYGKKQPVILVPVRMTKLRSPQLLIFLGYWCSRRDNLWIRAGRATCSGTLC